VLGLAPVVKFDFNNGGVNISKMPVLSGAFATSCISDTQGNLQFYSITYNIAQINGDLMQNGDSTNSPGGMEMSNHYGGGSLFPQSDIILPKKGNQYYVFATGMSDSNWTKWYGGGYYPFFEYLNYSIVDMDSNGGLGKVLVKNKIILDSQTYFNVAMSAVRHGNGKDWWLVKEDYRKHGFQVFRITPDSIIGPTYYYVPVAKRGNYWAQSTVIEFSRDGKQMASTMYSDMIDSIQIPQTWDYNRVDLYDFDRCTGAITHRQKYIVPAPYDTDGIPPLLSAEGKCGVCFSPNSQLLYFSTIYSIYQLNLADTAVHHGLKVHGIDTLIDFFPLYNTMALAPNNKIYIGNFGGTRKYMSTIDNPDVLGMGCGFHSNAVSQPFNANLKSPPYMPYFGLVSEVCFPAGNGSITQNNNKGPLRVYPNPASTHLIVESEQFGEQPNEIILSTLLGQVLQRQVFKTSTKQYQLNIAGLARGVYMVAVKSMGTEKQLFGVRKVVVE
jgi:hypothetical protein